MNIAVIIPSKTISNLVPCVEAVRKHEPEVRIIVVDDGVDWAATETELEVDVVEGVKPFVFSRNINIGIRYAMEDAGCIGVVLLNDDAILQSPSGFTLLARECEAHSEIGIVGATTNVTGQPLQKPRGVGMRVVEHFAFVAVYIPRTTIDRIGVLDERYALDYGCEDRCYCRTVESVGMRCAVHDGCYVDHGSLVSTFRGDPKAPKSFAQNYALYLQKWGGKA